MIRDVKETDALDIAEIYNYYIENTVITFEDVIVSEIEIKDRMNTINQKGYPYIVSVSDKIDGYAYLNTWRERSAYNMSLELSIYLRFDSCGKGIGYVLMEELLARAKFIDVHSLISAISLPNDSSRKLYEKFNLIGNFKEVGNKFNRYVDVEFWQLII